MRVRPMTMLLLPMAALGCSSGRKAVETAYAPSPVAAALPPRYQGYFEFDFEKQAFRPCGSREEWWVWGAPLELQARYGQRTFVVMEGEVSPRGTYGHQGKYKREIHVKMLVTADPGGREAGCASSLAAAPLRREGGPGAERVGKRVSTT